MILNEKKYAEYLIASGNIGTSPVSDAAIICRYYHQVSHLPQKETKRLVCELMSMLVKDYNPQQWIDIVERIMLKSKNKPLTDFEYIPVSSSELAKIKTLNGKPLQRLCFTMVCLAKFHNMKNERNNGWVNADPKDVFKLAKVNTTATEQARLYRCLVMEGFIEVSKKITNLNARITFIDNADEELQVPTFDNIGYEYMNYIGDKFIRCKGCGTLIRTGKTDSRLYCGNCSDRNRIRIRRINCVDCGKELVVVSRNKRTCRCTECQEIETKRLKAESRKRTGNY